MSEKKQLKIAITGPPAAGKSTVLKVFEQMGYPVFSADEVVHELSRPCQKGYHAVLKRWGERFLLPDGTLNRRALLEKMLEEPEFKKGLEEIFHPLVKERLLKWFAKHPKTPVLVAEIPLLYQAGWEGFFDRIIFVECPEDLLKKRLLARLKDEDLAHRLLKAYRTRPSKGDFVIKGNLPLDEITDLLQQVADK